MTTRPHRQNCRAKACRCMPNIRSCGRSGLTRTYYRPMTAAQFADYAAQVPESFRFLVKAHEYCTLAGFGDHPRYGTRRGQPNSLFLDPHYATQEVIGPFTDGLKDKAGPLLFQFSPQDYTSLAGPGSFVERLYQFLDRLPRGPLYRGRDAEFHALYPRVCRCLIRGRCLSLPEWPSQYADGPRASRSGSTGTQSGACRPLDAGSPSELSSRKTKNTHRLTGLSMPTPRRARPLPSCVSPVVSDGSPPM